MVTGDLSLQLRRYGLPAQELVARAFSRFQSRTIATATAALLILMPGFALAQGVLTVTPGRTIHTTAGTGTVGFSGDGGFASSALLARPAGIAYDAAGDLFLADADNHVIREISAAGVISTVAGSGVAGFGGDGGPATAAFLDTPTGVAVDASGNLYIADSHNQRIRAVANGTITTIAGTGTAGYAGDGGAATSAQLALPSGIAVDASGNLYIADTNNQRIRMIAGGILTTVAGTGEEVFAGDGGAATAASLDQPTGVAVDTAGNVYVADKNDHRVRIISPAGIISTLAGSGMPGFAGGFDGDGAAANAAALAKPRGVGVDSQGNVYVADTNNQRIRQIAGGGIVTVAGTGDQGFGGDGSPATSAILNSPHAVLADAAGNLSIADTLNQRLRSGALGVLRFGSQIAGTASSPQAITLTNNGTGSLTVAAVHLSGPFALAAGSTCSALPIVLSAGGSCTQSIAFTPVTAGTASGSVMVSASGVPAQEVLLAGVATGQTPTTIQLTESKAASLSGEAVTFRATLGSKSIVSTGTVTFYEGAAALGSSSLSNGAAVLTTTLLTDGPQIITAVYSGNASLAGSTSAGLVENVADFNFTLGTTTTATVEPGHSIVVPVSVAANGDAGLSASLTLTTAGLPRNLNVSFTPATVPLSNGQLAFVMNVSAAPVSASNQKELHGFGAGGAVFALLVLPLLRRRRYPQGIRSLTVALFTLASGMLLASLAGCGTNSGFFGQASATYNVNVIATATDATGGILTRTSTVPVNVQ